VTEGVGDEVVVQLLSRTSVALVTVDGSSVEPLESRDALVL